MWRQESQRRQHGDNVSRIAGYIETTVRQLGDRRGSCTIPVENRASGQAGDAHNFDGLRTISVAQRKGYRNGDKVVFRRYRRARNCCRICNSFNSQINPPGNGFTSARIGEAIFKKGPTGIIRIRRKGKTTVGIKRHSTSSWINRCNDIAHIDISRRKQAIVQAMIFNKRKRQITVNQRCIDRRPVGIFGQDTIDIQMFGRCPVVLNISQNPQMIYVRTNACFRTVKSPVVAGNNLFTVTQSGVLIGKAHQMTDALPGSNSNIFTLLANFTALEVIAAKSSGNIGLTS